ncbi:ADP-glyceromanno-heptose 6-epimerase [Humisphaera borealis]|uniref:ADP-glyceromanno-heptose 6-epimerase n=1 Tax=Humisphaera borealis TaxID=2807512 RepID=A0A7M2WWP9_9BACT|nr:ADP-glyceromanno-heptose 6-epimerase [Humisphaera borealis]QOV89632.1 ADP-glyceromanno-heptose 6-epimerase [Humisphaera borealis]
MRMLVTGGAGFIGSNLAKRLLADGHDVVVLDDFSSATFKNLVDFRGDVLTLDLYADDLNTLQASGPFDVIFHQASITDTTVLDQRKMMQNNAEGFRHLLNLAEMWGSRMVWASSAATYGRGPAPMKESQRPEPLNVYGYSKLSMEDLARQYAPRLKHPIVGLRYFNVYGPGEQHKGKFASMIHQLAKQMRLGKRPRIFAPGDQKRDFVYIEDVMQMNLRAAASKVSGVFNVGAGAAASFNDVVTQLNRVLKTDLPPEYFENPYDFFQTWTEADLTESRASLGYAPKYDLSKGIDAYHASGTLGSD